MARKLASALLLGMVARTSAGIYPEGHFDHSHKLTTSNFDSIVKEEVDSGRTLFVRWIASEVVKFANNPAVAFGDINLSQEQIRGDHNPGAGGWPTVRYFNKQTGYGGAAYKQKTSKRMCEELGDDEFMEGFVLEYGGTSLCSVATEEGCSEKEAAYITKMKASGSADIKKQLDRLQNMSGDKMNPDLRVWLNQRLSILKQLGDAESKSEL